MDMWTPYRDAVQIVMPQAQVIIDKFHVVKMVNEALETVRKSIRESLTDRQRRTLMHDRYILLHRYSDLDESKRLILEAWTENFPELKAAYWLKESFFDIWTAAAAVRPKHCTRTGRSVSRPIWEPHFTLF